MRQKKELKKSAATSTNSMPVPVLVPDNNKTSNVPKLRNQYNNDTTIICHQYRLGKCNKEEQCVYKHPSKCINYCRYGHEGCGGGFRQCQLLHPVMCCNSLNNRECFDLDCTLTHLKGTVRRRPMDKFTFRPQYAAHRQTLRLCLATPLIGDILAPVLSSIPLSLTSTVVVLVQTSSRHHHLLCSIMLAIFLHLIVQLANLMVVGPNMAILDLQLALRMDLWILIPAKIF